VRQYYPFDVLQIMLTQKESLLVQAVRSVDGVIVVVEHANMVVEHDGGPVVDCSFQRAM
jgi:hypothetical protein